MTTRGSPATATRDAVRHRTTPRGGRGRLPGVVGSFLANFIQFLLMALWILVFARVLLSWVDPTGRNQVSGLLIQATEPILAPVRRMLPQSGMIDWSGFIVLIVLGFLWRAF